MNNTYLKAAKLVDSDREEFSCCAINFFSEEYESVLQYEKLFSPDKRHGMCAWGYFWGDTNEERKQCRVISLMFMHWIANEGEA